MRARSESPFTGATWQAGCFLALTLLLFLRRPGNLVNPQFRAEDGVIFSRLPLSLAEGP